MKPFEERYTAWIEGRLSAPEREAFEKELDHRPVTEMEDERESRLLGDLLRIHASAPPLTNPEFFNHQIMARIAADKPQQAPVRKSRGIFGSPFARFAWAGAAVAVLGWVVAKTVMPIVPGSPTSPRQPAYFAQVIDARSSDPNISATVLHSDEDNVTVLWLDGMDYLPASYELH
jgi:hypothetical protein